MGRIVQSYFSQHSFLVLSSYCMQYCCLHAYVGMTFEVKFEADSDELYYCVYGILKQAT